MTETRDIPKVKQQKPTRHEGPSRPDLSESDRLTGDEALLAALLRGATLAAAAKGARLSERTAAVAFVTPRSAGGSTKGGPR